MPGPFIFSPGSARPAELQAMLRRHLQPTSRKSDALDSPCVESMKIIPWNDVRLYCAEDCQSTPEQTGLPAKASRRAGSQPFNWLRLHRKCPKI